VTHRPARASGARATGRGLRSSLTAQREGRGSHGLDGDRAGRSSSGVSLLEVEPELGPLLTGEEAAEARRFVLPARTVRKGANVIGLVEETDAFGAIVLDGLLLEGVQIGKRPSLRLVDPGRVVPLTRSAPPVPIATVSLRAATRSRIVLLDRHFLVAARRWPQLVALIYRRAVESSEALATQLAISHLSRVDERLMALMWLLADNWGHVTPAGIRIRLALTHDALGEFVGAQRSTVTLALKQLAERGALIRQDKDWVILAPPPEPSAAALEPSRLLDAPRPRPAWSPPAEPEARDGQLAQLRAELARLKEEYAPDKARAHDLQDEARQLRARTQELFDDANALSDIARTNPAAATARSSPKT